jgi:hypothetical protein
MTQEFASPTTDDIFTQTWNRADLLLTNSPGPLQIKIHVNGNVTGTCLGLDAIFTGNGGPVTQIDEGTNGCKASWDFQGFSPPGTNGSALLIVRVSALGQKGSTYGAAKGTITTTIELLDSSDPFFPE